MMRLVYALAGILDRVVQARDKREDKRRAELAKRARAVADRIEEPSGHVPQDWDAP